MQKRFEIDPVTGLRLEVLDPLPNPQQAVMANLGMTDTGTIPPPPQPVVIEPFNPDGGAGNPQASQAPQTSEAPKAGPTPIRAGGQGLGKRSFLDNLIHTIAGKSDADLRLAGNQKELSERASRRKAASAAAKSAAEAPGESYMDIPVAGSGEGSQQLTQMIGGAARLIGKLFGAG